jgi:hypothetical protein
MLRGGAARKRARHALRSRAHDGARSLSRARRLVIAAVRTLARDRAGHTMARDRARTHNGAQ